MSLTLTFSCDALCVCVRRQTTTPSWDFTRVLSWKILTMHGCAPMTCLGWHSTTLAKARGSIPDERATRALSHYGGRSRCATERREGGESRGNSSLPPSILFTPVWQTPGFLMSITELAGGYFSKTTTSTSRIFFGSWLNNQMPPVCPSTDLHDAGSPHYIIYRQARAERHLLAYWRHSLTLFDSTLFLLSCSSLGSARTAVDCCWSVTMFILSEPLLFSSHIF